MARKTLKKENVEKMNVKLYKHILRKKKDEFMQTRREELIYLGKNNLKLFWQELQPRKKQIENNITSNQWFECARQLYEKEYEAQSPRVNTNSKLFTLQEVENGIKKLKTRKAKDLVELQAEYLKWGMSALAPHIMKIFNNIIQQGFPRDWRTSLAIPLLKVETLIIHPTIEQI